MSRWAEPEYCTECHNADYGDVLIEGVCGKCLLLNIVALAAELARLQRVVSTAELINAEAQLKNDNESKSLSISNNLLRDLADALKAGE